MKNIDKPAEDHSGMMTKTIFEHVISWIKIEEHDSHGGEKNQDVRYDRYRSTDRITLSFPICRESLSLGIISKLSLSKYQFN